MAKITGAQLLLVGPRRHCSRFTGTVIPIGFCGDRPESHAGAGRFSTAAPIGTMGLPDLQPDAARVVSGDLSRLDIQPECRGASGLPLGLLAGLVPTLGTTLEARKVADLHAHRQHAGLPDRRSERRQRGHLRRDDHRHRRILAAGPTDALLLLLSPLAMGLAASGLGQYPYGGSARITQYAAPSICVLTGLGCAVLFSRLLPPASCRRSVRLTAVLLALFGAYFAINDLVRPYRTYEDSENRRFARWFWSEIRPRGRPSVARCDLDLLFDPKDWRTGMSAVYLCHQRIYANHNAGKGFRRRFAGDQPMRLVFFDRIPQNAPLYDRWLADVLRCLRDQKTFGVRRES